LAFGVLSFPLTYSLQGVVGNTSGANLGAALTGGSAVLAIGLLVGWSRGLSDRLQKQADELKRKKILLEEEVQRRMKAEERLLYEALHDPLTSLPNRRLLIDRLEHAVASNQRNPDKSCAFLYLDLNRFKSINDNYGHDAGDQLLIQVAGRLRSSLRAMDTVARVGGDEFAILLEALSTPDEAMAIVRRIHMIMALPYQWRGKPIIGGASIGIVMNLTVYEQIDDIMRDADIAMYRAKSGGTNGFWVFGLETKANEDFQKAVLGG
jgi:diguanylate cyclase (GGDEF)-like protein